MEGLFSPLVNGLIPSERVRYGRKASKEVAKHKTQLPPHEKSCPCCGPEFSEVVFTSNGVKYNGREYGEWPWCYICLSCFAYVGVHPNTVIPLGILADQATMDARKAAHKAFDPLWRDGPLSRKEAYKYLAEQLGIQREDCHISWFDIDTCKRVVCAAIQYKNITKPAVEAPKLGGLFAKLGFTSKR